MFTDVNDIYVGAEAPVQEVDLSFAQVAMTPFATWDFFPGHNDPAYARGQGQRDIYLNTIALQGFADRVVTDWLGPKLFIRRRNMTMRLSAYAGDRLLMSGTVTSRERQADGSYLLQLAIRLDTASGRICDVETTVIIGRPI